MHNIPPPPCAYLLTFHVHQVLLKRRPPPTAFGVQGEKPSGAAASHLVLGTLSAVVGHPINGYLPMPDWCSVQPDSSVREPPKEEPRALATATSSRGAKGKKGASDSDFYSGSGSGSEGDSETGSDSGSSPEYSSEDGSESDPYDSASTSENEDEESESRSSESGESGSESERTSDNEESDSSLGSRSSESSSASSSGDSSESRATKGEEGLGLLIMGPGSSTNTAAATTYGASAPAAYTQDLTGLVERMGIADREDSASPQLGASASMGGGLASLSTAEWRGPGGPILSGRTSSTSSVLSSDPERDTSASFPSTLLRHQASGGLQVDYRFARGRVNALSRPSTILTLRLVFINHGKTPVRRVRVVAPRDGTPMEAFPEIQLLAAGATNTANLGIDFGGKAKDVSGQSQVATRHCFSAGHIHPVFSLVSPTVRVSNSSYGCFFL